MAFALAEYVFFSGNWLYRNRNTSFFDSANVSSYTEAGAGNDPRSDRQFNPVKQAKDYDADGSCMFKSLSGIAAVADLIYRCQNMDPKSQRSLRQRRPQPLGS